MSKFACHLWSGVLGIYVTAVVVAGCLSGCGGQGSVIKYTTRDPARFEITYHNSDVLTLKDLQTEEEYLGVNGSRGRGLVQMHASQAPVLSRSLEENEALEQRLKRLEERLGDLAYSNDLHTKTIGTQVAGWGDAERKITEVREKLAGLENRLCYQESTIRVVRDMNHDLLEHTKRYAIVKPIRIAPGVTIFGETLTVHRGKQSWSKEIDQNRPLDEQVIELEVRAEAEKDPEPEPLADCSPGQG